MIAHGNKQIKKQPPPALHLHLHRPAPLKRRPAPDDQRQIMRPELRIAVRRVRIRVPRARQDRRTLDPRLQALFAQREPLQLVEAVLFCRAVEQCIFEQGLARQRMIYRAFDDAAPAIVVGGFGALELPHVPTLVVQ